MGPTFGRRVAALATVGTAALVGGAAPITEGPPPGFTGGFGEPSCVACHTGSDVNAFGGRVSVEGLPDVYEPEHEYVLTVVLEAEGTEVAGFQLSSRFAGGDLRGRDAGTLHPTDEKVAVTDSAGISYAHQSRAGAHAAAGDRASWTLVWVAPRRGGPVALHLAANSGNGDNSPLSDLVYTSSAVLPASSR